jgi:hypothetical protein
MGLFQRGMSLEDRVDALSHAVSNLSEICANISKRIDRLEKDGNEGKQDRFNDNMNYYDYVKSREKKT